MLLVQNIPLLDCLGNLVDSNIHLGGLEPYIEHSFHIHLVYYMGYSIGQSVDHKPHYLGNQSYECNQQEVGDLKYITIGQMNCLL